MMNSLLEKAILEQENEALKITVSDLIGKNKKLEAVIDAYREENKTLYEGRAELKHKNAQLMEIVEGLEEEVEELDNECNRLSDALEEEEGQVIHYIAVSLDLELCVPLVSENPIEAGQELINKCLAKGVPYGGFKVFEKSELL